MSTFATTGLLVPSEQNDISQGGGPSILTIRVKNDFTDVYASALWNIIPLLTQYDENRTSSGNNTPSPIVLLQNKSITPRRPAGAVSDVNLELPFTTLMDTLEIEEFLDTRAGWKEFIAAPKRLSDTLKLVWFGFGEWKQDSSRSRTGNTASSRVLTFVPEKHGLATADITMPVLPLNTDAALDGSDEANEYLGWIFGVADAAKGGFGPAVTMPTSSELHATKLGINKKYTV